jgi:hypothetical protein
MAKTCVRCGLPMDESETGGRHFNPDHCVDLLQKELKQANQDKEQVRQGLYTLIEIASLPTGERKIE